VEPKYSIILSFMQPLNVSEFWSWDMQNYLINKYNELNNDYLLSNLTINDIIILLENKQYGFEFLFVLFK